MQSAMMAVLTLHWCCQQVLHTGSMLRRVGSSRINRATPRSASKPTPYQLVRDAPNADNTC